MSAHSFSVAQAPVVDNGEGQVAGLPAAFEQLSPDESLLICLVRLVRQHKEPSGPIDNAFLKGGRVILQALLDACEPNEELAGAKDVPVLPQHTSSIKLESIDVRDANRSSKPKGNKSR